jgi:hypothetical protein
VWPQRLQTMHLLGLPDVFTTDTTATRVRAVPMYSFSVNTLEDLNSYRPRKCPTIGILPSGLPWVKKSLKKNEFLSGSFLTSRYKRSRCDTDSTQVQMDKQIAKTGSPKMLDKYVFSVPYSDHSNYAELEDFIKFVKPNSLKGIVSSSTCYIEPMYYFGRLCTGNQPVQQLHNRSKLIESCNVEEDDDELDGSISKESYKMNDIGKRVVTIGPETSFEDDYDESDDETSFEHDNVELDETSCEDGNVELYRNRSKNMFEMKENGKIVVNVSPKTSVRDDNVELGRNRMKVLKVKLLGFRMRRLRKQRRAKISDHFEKQISYAEEEFSDQVFV